MARGLSTGEGLLAGLASAIPGAIQGYQDMKANEMKMKELEAKAEARQENQRWKELANKMAAEKSGYEIVEGPGGDLDLQRMEGMLSPAQMQMANLRAKGIMEDPEGEGFIETPFKQREQELQGLLNMAKLRGQQFKLDPFVKKEREGLGEAASEWISQSRGQFEGNLKNVDRALELLRSGKDITGKTKGLIPEIALPYLSEDTAIAQQAMQKAIQDTLRPTLGAQFTEKEGERIMRLSFDPSLDEEENARRAQLLKDVIQKKMKFNDAFYSHLRRGNDVADFPFEKYGMKYTGESPREEETAETVQAVTQATPDEVSEAEKWARENPNDPRSAEILRRIGK